MRFLEFLKQINEDIPVGLKNKELWFDYLKDNFKKPDNLFVTFVYQDKVGINPKSIYDTPIGVYTYPLDFIYDEEDVPFRGEKKPNKIKVLKNKTNKILSNDLSDGEYEKKIKQIEKFVEESDKYSYTFKKGLKEYIKRWEDAARKQTNFGSLWNITRMITMDFYANKNSKDTGPTKNNPVVWTKLLIDLGYDIVIDYSTGTIHPSEPTQAVFLNPKSYKVVGEEFVDTEARYHKTQKNTDKDLIDVITKGYTQNLIDEIIIRDKQKLLKISNDKDFDALSYSIRVQNFNLFSYLKKYFEREIDKHFIDYFNRSLTFLAPKDVKNEFVDYFIKLNHPKIFDPEIPINKLLKYLKRTTTEFKNKKEIIKKLENDSNLDDLENSLKKVGDK
jgi:hypothetical protein